jgi:peptidoglycan hydrolase-like protein with peptidoglycan-binding domain
MKRLELATRRPPLGQDQMKRGDHSEAVRACRTFGPNTGEAVRGFRQALGLSADGIVGSLTWRAPVSGMLTSDVTLTTQWAHLCGESVVEVDADDRCARPSLSTDHVPEPDLGFKGGAGGMERYRPRSIAHDSIRGDTAPGLTPPPNFQHRQGYAA